MSHRHRRRTKRQFVTLDESRSKVTHPRPAQIASSPAIVTAPDPAQVMSAIANLWTKVKPTMLERVTTIENATLALMEGSLPDDPRREAEREAHKIAGSAGSFGFANASKTGQEIELVLGQPTELTYDDALRLADLVVKLRDELDRETVDQELEVETVKAVATQDEVCVLVVGIDDELVTSLEAETAARGLHLQFASNLTEAEETVKRSRPAAVLLDLAAIDQLDAVAELSQLLSGSPILVLTDHDSFTDRAQIARSGVRYVLPKPQSPRALREAIVHTIPSRWAETASILVVDDDANQLLNLDHILTPAGFNLTLAQTAQAFWEAIRESTPDLIILDVDLPDVNGLDLCRILRSDAQRDGLPILFLTVKTDPITIRQMFAAGADDYVPKPVVGPELRARIVNRLERSRLQRATVESDSLTGLASRYKAELAFDKFFRLAGRQHTSMAVASLEIDRFQQLADEHGHATADQVLQHLGHLLLKHFRGHDIAARWGEDEFVIGLFGANRELAVLRLNEILKTFENELLVDADGVRFSASFSAGAVEYPSDGRTLSDLYRAAKSALCEARSDGGARVVGSHPAHESSSAHRSVDVVLVDDDEVVASLLLHALAARGYRTEWFKDGEKAARNLAGAPATLHARVVLLDVGLPGMDGYDVLRRLVDSDIIAQTRVIMLTAHATESEQLSALELGAFDHVAKPFSMPVLLQRIQRAIHD